MQRALTISGKLKAFGQTMSSTELSGRRMRVPKLLINLAILAVFATTGLFVAILWMPPYTGFMLAENPTSHHMQVIKADDWVIEQGLNIGDEVLGITAPDGTTLKLEPKHILTSTYQARDYYENREERLKELAKVHQILDHGKVELDVSDKQPVNLILDQPRTLSSISLGVWVRFFLSLTAPFLATLVWVWRPKAKEGVFLLFSGVGLFILTLPSAATIYQIDMYYPSAFLFWFLKLLGGLGMFIFMGFATCLMLYFPQKLENADVWARRLLLGLLAYAVLTLFDTWKLGAPLSAQFLYYSYNETYVPMIVYFVVLLRLCFLQWQRSEQQPVQRSQALWVILSWMLGPSIFVVFYLLPIALGQEGLLNRTMNTIVITGGFWMVLVGVGRFQLFQIEQYISAAYQWSLISLLFFSLDILLVYAVNISPQISSFILLALILWAYLPARQWIHTRVSQNRQTQYQRLFNDAIADMVEDSMTSSKLPEESWKVVLDNIFSPIYLQRIEQATEVHADERGQSLVVPANHFSSALRLEYAENGGRLFTRSDVELVTTLSLLFVRLHEFQDAYLSGQNQERERIRRDLHDQVGHKLLSLIYSATDVKSQRLAQETMEQLRELIQALKEEPVLIQDSLVDLKRVCEDACEHAEITLQWVDSTNLGASKITSNQHLNILNIARELLNNTIRHSKADKLAIMLSNFDNSLVVTIADNGTGFDQQSITPGSGLHNIQSRIEELQAKITWNTTSGTQATLTVPLNSISQAA